MWEQVGISIGLVGTLRRINLHPAMRDLGLIGSSSLVTTIAAMVVIAVVGKSFGPALLGEYLLIRRMASWLQAGVQIPSGVALPRYVAASVDQPEAAGISYFFSALLIACGIGAVLCVVLLLWRDQISRLLFGSTELNHLAIPLAILLLGLAVHGVVFGYFQGTLRMGRAGILQVCNFAIVPILCVVILRRGHSIPQIVNAIGAAMIVCACLFVIPMLRKGDLAALSSGQLKKHGSELFSFGITRLSGDFGLQALLSLPAVIAARYFPIGSVVALLLAGSFLTAVAAATMPMGIILLSRVSRSIAGVGSDLLQSRVSYFASALIELSVFVGLQTVLFADVIVRIWVGPRFLEDLGVIQISILAVPFYFIYAGLRGVIDAGAIRAHNAINIYVALVVFAIAAVCARVFLPESELLVGLAAGGVVGMTVLAITTLRTVGRLFRVKIDWREMIPGIAIGILCGGLSFLVHREFGGEIGLGTLVACQGALLVVYLLALALINAPWIVYLRSMMITYSRPKQEASD